MADENTTSNGIDLELLEICGGKAKPIILTPEQAADRDAAIAEMERAECARHKLVQPYP